MGRIVDRLNQIARNARDLRPMAEPVRQVIWKDNADAIMQSQDGNARQVAGLKPTTLKERKGSGPARAPHGRASRMIAGLVVIFRTTAGQLEFSKSWPFDWVKYYFAGTKKMPARDPTNVRPEAKGRILELFKTHVLRNR